MRVVELVSLCLVIPISVAGQPITLQHVLTIGEDDEIFFLVSALVTDEEGNIYVVDQKGNSLWKFDPEGNELASVRR